MADRLRNPFNPSSSGELPTGPRKYYPLVILLVIVVGCLIGVFYNQYQQNITRDETAAKEASEAAELSGFTAPLYDRELPDKTRLVTRRASINEDGSAFVCLIIQSEMAKSQLEDFYQDTGIVPAKEGQRASIRIFPLDEDSLKALKKTDDYQEEGGYYWFVYVYSE